MSSYKFNFFPFHPFSVKAVTVVEDNPDIGVFLFFSVSNLNFKIFLYLSVVLTQILEFLQKTVLKK
jgi:hypothetical protein